MAAWEEHDSPESGSRVLPGPVPPQGREVEHVAAFRTQLRHFLHRTDAVTATAGLTPQRYDLLLMIAARPGRKTTVGELCSTLDLNQQAVTELVKRAAAAGLVHRERSTGDRRVVVITLTEDGARRFERAFEALAADRATIAQTLARLQDAATAVGLSSGNAHPDLPAELGGSASAPDG